MMEQIFVTFQTGAGDGQQMSTMLDADGIKVADDGTLLILKRGLEVAAYASGVWLWASPFGVPQPLTAESP